MNRFLCLLSGILLAVPINAAPWTAFRPGEVTVGGEIGRRLEVTADRMLHNLDFENTFARHFRARKEKPDVWGGFAGYGMVLDAVVKAAAHGIGGEETVAFKKKWIGDLLATQTPDGNISIFAGEPGVWDNHEQAYLVQALVLDHRWFGEGDSLAAAVRLADFLISRKTSAQLGLDTAFVLLAEETGERKYLDCCREAFREEGDMADYDAVLPVNGTKHVYTWLQRAHAQLLYAAATGRRTAKMEAVAGETLRRVFGDFVSITGSCTGQPGWGELWDETQRGVGKWGETCGAAYLMRYLAESLRRDPQARFGDLYERILWNAFFAAQSEDGTRQRYFVPFDEAGQWFERETYCCPNNFRRMMFEIPDAVFFRTSDGVAVNLYTPAELKSGETRLTMATRYPEDGRVELTFADPAAKALLLRIPGWCARAAVDGKPIAAKDGWARVEGDWTGGRTVSLDLEMTPRFEKGTKAQASRVAVTRGPLVFGAARESFADVKPSCGRPFSYCANQLLDAAEIRTDRPLVYTNGCVRASFVVRTETRSEQTVSLVPFSSGTRERTYFPSTRRDKL